MIMHLSPASLDGFDAIESFYRDFVHALNQPNAHTCLFNLSAIDFLSPEAVLSLITASKLWHRSTGNKIQWQVSNQDVLKYLERMDIFTQFAECIHPPALPAERWSRTSSRKVLEVQRISSDIEQNSAKVPEIMYAAQKLLEGSLFPTYIGTACSLISEVCQNITHSQIADDGYALIQVYDRKETGLQTNIAVGDIGCGIEHSLKVKYPRKGTPADYLMLALKSGVSSRNAASGLGLHQVQQTMLSGGGTLTIRSGTARLQVDAEKIYKTDGLVNIAGTQVFITFWGWQIDLDSLLSQR